MPLYVIWHAESNGTIEKIIRIIVYEIFTKNRVILSFLINNFFCIEYFEMQFLPLNRAWQELSNGTQVDVIRIKINEIKIKNQ